MSCKIIYTNGIPTGVEEVNSTNPSKAFQEILNNSQVKSFDEALQIYKNMYAEDIKFSIIGEKGAKNLDQIEEVTFRLDNLKVAKEMQDEGNTPLEIRLLTNWEWNVADKKWRYEIQDGTFNEVDLEFNTSITLFENPVGKTFLGAVYNNDELYKAYPQIKNTDIYVFETDEEIYDENKMFILNNKIYLNKKLYDTENNTLRLSNTEATAILHESQHLLQNIEGFGKGSSKYYNRQKIKESISFARENFGTGKLRSGTDAEYDRYIKDILRKGLTQEVVDSIYSENRVDINLVAEKTAQIAYENFSGEVEARNVEKRFFLTPTERLETLLSETQDIPYENQLVSGVENIQASSDPQIKYQTQDGRIFSEYKEALKNTQGENIKAGISTVEGFKEFFSVSSNTSLETTEGFINNMIKSGLLSGKTYKEKGNVNHIAEGNSEAKKILNAQAVKEMFQKQFGKSAVRVNGDNTITIIEDNKRDVIKITNKKGEKVTLDNTKTFEELIKEFDKETVAIILANRLYKEATPSKSKVEEVKIVPENELIEKLISLLKKFGIQTMAFDTYLKGYSDRNSLPINAKALADIANKLIAFKDGVVENDDLIEEISHLIEASIPMSQKENILRNIHKTKEWMDNYDTYKDLYATEEELRREILGKVIANSLKENFASRESNQTENAIIAKIKELFDQFIQSIKNYFQDSYIAELDKLTQDVYTNLMNESLDLSLENRSGVFFSTTSASPTSFKLLNTAKTLLDKARLLENALGKKYRNPANRASLELATEQIDNATKAIKTAEELRAIGEFDKAEKALEKAEDLMAVASLVRLTSSQVNILEKSINNMTDKLLSPEENVVFQYLKDNVVDSLAEVKYNLKESNSKIEAELIQEIDQINKKIGSITGAFENNKKKVFDNIINRQVASMELETEKEQEEYRAIISAHLNGVQKDTDYIHSILGSLLHSRNAILNLAGNVIERMNQKQRDNFQQAFKKFINSKITNTDLEKLIVDWNIIHEIDIAKQEAWVKEQKLKIINTDTFKIAASLDNIPQVEDIDAYIEENASAVGLKLYKKELKKVLKGRFETYFKKEFIEEMKNHSIVIDGKTLKLSEIEDSAKEIDDRYKEQSTQILINAGGNLTKADHEARRQISKNRQIEANPRNADGTLKDGIKEVYDEAKGQYVVMLDASPSVWNRMSVEDRQNVKTIVGLNHISYIKQDFYKGKNGDKKGQPIPDKFIEAVKALKTNEEKMEFIRNNSYISFPDNYFDELNKTKNVVDRLREALSDEKFEDKVEDIENLIKRIRSKQSITSRVLKANKVFNSPGETNFTDMNKVAMDEVRLAQTDLEALYAEARPFLEESEMEALEGVDNITNEAYRNHLEDAGIKTLEDKLTFIYKHTTEKGTSAITEALDVLRGRKTMKTSMEKRFPNGLNEATLLTFAESKLLPYLKKTEPVGYSELMQQINNEEIDADEILNREDLVKITPTIAYYENIDENVNPKWLENRDAKKEQYTESYLKEVGNSEFETMFKVGANGKRNNQDLWEKREALLEYYDQMIEYNNLTGSQSRYMYPGVRRTGVERAQSVSFKGVKESLIELIEFRPEEKETGELTAHSLYTIPTYYTSPLKEKDEHTKNYLGAFLEYGQAATLHNARQESVGDMLVLGDNLEKTEVQGKALGTSNSYKMFKSFMEYNYYGVKENFNYEVQLGTRTWDVGKTLRVLNSFAKRVNLSGLIVPITNILQGSIQKNMEKMIGETINSEASLRGNKKFQKYAPDSMKEVGGLASNSVLNVVMESLGVVNLHSRFMDAQFGKAGRLALNSESRLHEAANFAVVPRAVLGIIADYKIVDGRIISSSQFKKKMAVGALKDKNKEWGDYENFDDYYYSAVKDGVLDFKGQAFLDSFKGKIDLEGQELIDYLQDKKENISMRALSFTQRVDSQVPMHQKSAMARHGIANFFLSHLNYLLVALPNKTKHRHFNTAEDGQEQEGSWRTAFNFLAKVVVNPKNTLKAYKEASDVEKRNLKRTMMEVAYANALAFAALLLANMNDDEPDPLYPVALADMFLTRVATEQIGSTIALPKSAYHSFDKPFMLAGKIGDWMEVHKLGGTSEQRSSYLNKLLPYIREIGRFSEPLDYRKTYQHFQADDKNLWYNYAWSTRFLKEDNE